MCIYIYIVCACLCMYIDMYHTCIYRYTHHLNLSRAQRLGPFKVDDVGIFSPQSRNSRFVHSAGFAVSHILHCSGNQVRSLGHLRSFWVWVLRFRV